MINPTPLVSVKRLASSLGLPDLLLKLESANPISHTFKDRGALAAVSKIRESGGRYVTAATCSNMGTAVSGAAAKNNLKSFVLVSDQASHITKKMIHSYATEAYVVNGDFDVLDGLITDITGQFEDAYCINSTLHEDFKRGFTGILDELLLQLNPEGAYVVIVPTADGTLFTAMYEEYVRRKPNVRIRFAIAQPSGCSPIVNALQSNQPSFSPVIDSKTIVIPLSVRNPQLYGNLILEQLRESGGLGVAVPDERLGAGIAALATLEGYYADPVGGLLVAAIEEVSKSIAPDETIIGILTGTGMVDYTCNCATDFIKTLSPYEARERLYAFIDSNR
ncbi:MAG: pyridoxal-phosphate dependent enzyme [Desulfuromonadaceae bacterium]